LLQQRSSSVDHYPNSLSISVVGHVDAGEDSTSAARREIKEELGLNDEDYTLNFIFSVRQEAHISSSYIDKQFNDVFTCFCPSGSEKIRIDKKDVASVSLIPTFDFVRLVEERDPRIPPFYEKEVKTLKRFLKIKEGAKEDSC
jgi:isopentenyldiphosphate isomerase